VFGATDRGWGELCGGGLCGTGVDQISHRDECFCDGRCRRCDAADIDVRLGELLPQGQLAVPIPELGGSAAANHGGSASADFRYP
jgi:hypothetical protein